MSSNIQYGSSSLSEIRELGALYIDKTERIYDLISQATKRFFLARPRRFGKTLLVDTLSEIFSGNKELFKGLSIYNKDYSWKSYPVIRLSLFNISANTSEELNNRLIRVIKQVASFNKYKIEWEKSSLAQDYLENLFLYFRQQNQKVVILIDEYDSPLLNSLSQDESTISALTEVMRSFYSVLKLYSDSIHFLLLTGVTRLAYTSIFSGMNNLSDISFDQDYCDIMGYTQEELEQYFSSEIEKGTSTLNTSKKEFLSLVKDWYDGYRFSDSDVTVYNPGDVNQFFQRKFKFVSYWTQTGTSTFLVKLLSSVAKVDLKDEIASPKEIEFFFSNLDLNELDNKENLVRLFYQTGYLTIKNYNSETEQYYLDFPNKEVSIAFSSYLVKSVWNKEFSYFSKYKKAGTFLTSGDIPGFIKTVEDLFKSITRTPQKYHENAIEIVIALLLKMSGGSTVGEQVASGDGIADIVVETSNTVYIIELKMDQKVEATKNQIQNRRYADKYLYDEKYKNHKIIGIGLCFSSLNCYLIDKGAWQISPSDMVTLL